MEPLAGSSKMEDLVKQSAAFHCADDDLELVADPQLSKAASDLKVEDKTWVMEKRSGRLTEDIWFFRCTGSHQSSSRNRMTVLLEQGWVCSELSYSKSWFEAMGEILQDTGALFKCGLLGHDEKKCKASVAVMVDNGRGGLTRLYGQWIFANVYSRTWWKEGKREIPSPPAMPNVEEIA
ncbi:hypothetical protein TIFTF001_021824 [Ficus carica]|uniref:Uncharacterized protein n=1 Tax=Ficus carica TaxID=3494 RepID=A0AA88DB44_FICCA|nr:hypothetical protein TIFTF001_021824 [Ficus carica]